MAPCERNEKCLKESGHAGWCQTKVKGATSKGASQDELFAARPAEGGKRSRAAPGAGRVAGMAELAKKRERKQRGEKVAYDEGSEDEELDESEGEGFEGEEGAAATEEAGGVEYSDYGMSKAERKAARVGGDAEAEAAAADDEVDESEAWSTGPEAALTDLESIRLRRSILEKWLLEPFFAKAVRGCVVRIGLQGDTAGGGTLYRVAEVVGVEEFADHPYTLGSRKTVKRLQLEFGESKQW